jgi:hypothetical protein
MRALIRLVPLSALLLLAACATPPDEHVPPFARVPYETISRDAVVAIALREWRLFGSPVADIGPQSESLANTAPPEKPERQQGLWQRVGEYWWIAGAGSRFPYAPDHAHYIDIAKRQAQHKESGWIVTAERAEDYAPRPGDLVCRGRDEASGLRFDDLPAGRYFPAHCDVVVDTSTPQQIAVVGGNDRDAVTMRHMPATPDGKLSAPETWLVVLRLEVDAPASQAQ